MDTPRATQMIARVYILKYVDSMELFQNPHVKSCCNHIHERYIVSKTEIKNNAHALLEYIESKNSHGRNKFTQVATDLGLGKSLFVRDVFRDKTSMGKNQLIRQWLYYFIETI